ncbi:hypothetical protein DAI22_12g072025 [Oryza sativa Japonica Group]|nr:hypothetical protein DAI22_12g072025 [Oryza sativa Japonica Group]
MHANVQGGGPAAGRRGGGGGGPAAVTVRQGEEGRLNEVVRRRRLGKEEGRLQGRRGSVRRRSCNGGGSAWRDEED